MMTDTHILSEGKKLGVLMAYKTGVKLNPYVSELVEALRSVGCQIEWNLEDFWARDKSYDVVHLQWPELLFNTKKEIDLTSLEETMNYWSEHARVVVTVHNLAPHDVYVKDQFADLYHIIYSRVDAFIHLGRFSLDVLKTSYPDAQHVVISHHVNGSDLEQGDSQIDPRENSVLIFGAIRNEEERNLIRKLMAKNGNEFTIKVMNWRPTFQGSRLRDPFGWLAHYLQMIVEKWRFGSSISFGFQNEEEVTQRFHSAQLILIVRTNALNSGVVFKGFAFGKVVVGPEIGNMGDVLKNAGNPTYSVADFDSLISAIRNGLKLAQESHGDKNMEYAKEHLRAETIAGQHLSLYQAILS